MKLKEITPVHLRCCAGGCPSIYESNRNTFVIVGRKLSADEINKDLSGKVSSEEEAIEISREFFTNL